MIFLFIKNPKLGFLSPPNCFSLFHPTNPLPCCHCRTGSLRPPRRMARSSRHPPTSGLLIPTQKRRRTAPEIARNCFVSRGGFVSRRRSGRLVAAPTSPLARPCLVDLLASRVKADQLWCWPLQLAPVRAWFLFERRRRATAGQPTTLVVFSELWVS